MTPSNVDPTDDYEALIACLNARWVEFLVVGAYAVGLHGYLRATDDFDVFIKPSPENAAKAAAAIKDFISVEVDPAALSREKSWLRLGRKPNSADFLTSISGVAWEEAWSDRVSGRFGAQDVHFLSRENLIRNKRASGRDKDRLDLKGLGADPEGGSDPAKR